MGYKWRPSKSQRREFADKMQNDPEFRQAYYQRKDARANKRRSGSQFDYNSAGGEYVPTKAQNDFCLEHSELFTTNDEKNAMNIVIYGYSLNEKIHHDNIHIVNEKMREYAAEQRQKDLSGPYPSPYEKKQEVILYGFDGIQLGTITAEIPEIELSIKRNILFDSPLLSYKDVADFLRPIYAPLLNIQEQFYTIYLNASNQIIGIHQTSKGGVTQMIADPKIILGIALKSLATAIIVSHSHPSGNGEPSDADKKMTDNLIKICKQQGITLLDHIIITEDHYYSFSQNKILGLKGITQPITVLNPLTTSHSMKITKENFKEEIKSIDLNTITDDMRNIISELKILTNDFTDWTMVEGDKDLAEIPDILFKYLNEQLVKKEVIPEPQKKLRATRTVKQKKEKPDPKKKTGEMVATVSPEIRIIKRYVNLDGKKLTREKILTFLSTVQKNIRSEAIRKTSKYADEIMHIQKELIKAWEKHRGSGGQFTFSLDDSDNKIKDAYKKIAESQKPRISIKLIKRYFSIHGRENVMDKANKLQKEVEEFISKYSEFKKKEPFWSEIETIHNSLTDYTTKETTVPELTTQQLNGFIGLGIIDYNHKLKKGDTVVVYSGVRGKVKKVMDKSIEIDTLPGHYLNKSKVRKIDDEPLDGCPCIGTALSGPGDIAPQLPQIVKATDLEKMSFQTIGFKDKWLLLIGDPCEPFSMMVWSKPGKGKSSLMIEFAYYLACQHNKKVLYAAKEEGIGYTLKDKFTRMNAFHDNIDISADTLPADLSKYNYVIIDSVNEFGLNKQSVKEMINKYPDISFILIFQAIGNGSYRGSKDFEHIVDVSIYINDNCYATAQKKRFGGGATIKVIPEENSKIYKFSTIQDAEKFKIKKSTENPGLKLVKGDDGKIWVVESVKAEELRVQGFEIL